jgi:predicted transcriptional regulator
MSTPTRKMYLSGPSGSVKKKKHSNADSERIFSMLKEIQTEHRSELANDTICSLICAKQNQNMECYEYCPNSEVLKKSKTACIDYNNELKK